MHASDACLYESSNGHCYNYCVWRELRIRKKLVLAGPKKTDYEHGKLYPTH